MPYVDYQEFKKENIGMVLKEWRDIIRNVDPDHPVIADNVSSMITSDSNYNRPQDDWNVAGNVDEFGISFYPKYDASVDPYIRWQTVTAAHSAVNSGRFWISELQSHHTTMFQPETLVYPYELRLWNWEAISHGAKGVIYWKWHPFIKGYQTFSRGLVNTRGEYTPRAYEASAICKILTKNGREFMEYEPEKPRTAILYDRLSQEFTKAYTNQSESLYLDSIAGLYKCLWENNIPAKFIIPEDIIANSTGAYKVIFITEQLSMSDELADALKRYIAAGGILICDGKFGEVNDTGILYRNIPGGKLNDILGYYLTDVEIGDMEIFLDWRDKKPIKLNGCFEKRCLKITQDTVEVPGRFLDESPAVMRTKYGNGQIVYISTHLWYGCYKHNFSTAGDFIDLLKDELKLSIHTISSNDLKICTLRGGDGLILFAFNYCGSEVSAGVKLEDMGNCRYNIKDLYTDIQYVKNSVDNKLELNITVPDKNVLIYKLQKLFYTEEKLEL